MTKNRTVYFSDGPYIQVLKALVEALTLPAAFVKLLGNRDTGKSHLITKLTQYLRRKEVKVIHFDKAVESPGLLRAALAQAFDLPLSANFISALEDALQEQNQKQVVLIFDDAHLLTNITLIEIYRLAVVQVNKKPLMNILLCGEPNLENRLVSNTEFKSLLHSVSHKLKLEPMKEDELGQCLARFGEKAGLPRLELEPAAISYFFKLCKGYPGPAASMCKVIMGARGNGAQLPAVTKAELVKIFSEANGEQALPNIGLRHSGKVNTVLARTAVLLLVIVGLISPLLNQPADVPIRGAAVQSLVPSNIGTDSSIRGNLEVETTQAVVSATAGGQAMAFAMETVAGSAREAKDLPAIVAGAARAGGIERNSESNSASLGTIPGAIDAEVSSAQETLSEATFTSISDSDLVLVTAEERGIDLSAIAEPAFGRTQPAQAIENNEETAEQQLNERTTEQSIEQSTLESTPEVMAERLDESIAGDSRIAELSAVEIASVPKSAITAPARVGANNELVVETVVKSDLNLEVLQRFIASWVDAWQTQSMESYFAAYHAGFEPRYYDSVPTWRNSRERVIGNADWIELQLSDFQYIGEEAGVVEVHFWLNYQSPTYQDNTQKKLLLSREAGKWRILEEINLQVRS